MKIYSQKEKRFDGTQVGFYRMIQRIPQTEYVNSDEVLKKARTKKKKLKINNRKKQLTFQGHVIRQGGFKNPILKT